VAAGFTILAARRAHKPDRMIDESARVAAAGTRRRQIRTALG
jgi:hypothetical protein